MSLGYETLISSITTLTQLKEGIKEIDPLNSNSKVTRSRKISPNCVIKDH